MRRTAGLVRVAVLSLPLLALDLAGAQSLGEAARRERERRQKQPGSAAKVYTGDDLAETRPADAPVPKPDPSTSPSSSPAAKPADASAAAVEPAEDEALVRRRLEAEWRERFANARERVASAEARAWVERVETVFVSGIPVQQRVRRFEETEELHLAKKALEDLEEAFRRTGLPPGWARE